MSRKKRPEVRVTLSLFDTRDPIYRAVRTGVPLGDFEPITSSEYRPSGGTPLRDAVGRFVAHLDQLRSSDVVTVGLLLDESGSMSVRRNEVIESVNQFVDGLRVVDAVDPDAAGTVLCVVVTDGEENSSREVDPQAIKRIVADSEKSGYTMIFLGSSIDAWSQGHDIGLSGGATGQMVSTSGRAGSTSSAMLSVTSDASSYLSSNAAYKQSRSSTSLRSVLDDGTEVMSNINEGK